MKRIQAFILTVLVCASMFSAKAFTPETVEARDEVSEHIEQTATAQVEAVTAKPGLNIITGTTAPLTFDEAPAVSPTVAARNASGSVTAAPTGVTGHDGSKVFKVSSITSRYPHVEYEVALEASRPYYFEFDVYSNVASINGAGNEHLWLINASKGSHINFKNGFSSAITAGKWYSASGTANYSDAQTHFHIQADAQKSDNSGTLAGIEYYFDNILVVPYYKVTYMYGDTVLATDYLNPRDAEGGFLTQLPLDLTKSPVVPGKNLLGWSTNASAASADAPAAVTAANEDIVLYAVTQNASTVTLTYMKGETNLGTETLNFNEVITKTAFSYGKAFKGWSLDGSTIITRAPETDATVYAVFEDIATEGTYGTLLYYNDFSGNDATEVQNLQGWNSDAGDLEKMDKYTFYDGNFLNNTTSAGLLRTGFATSKLRENPEIVSDPADTGNPVMRVRQTSNYPRFETYFYETNTSSNPIATPGEYTITYRFYVPNTSNKGSFYTSINKNNSWSTGTSWDARAKKISVTTNTWMTITQTVRIPQDLDKLGKLGVLRIGGDNGMDFYIDDYAIYYAPAVKLTFKKDSTTVATEYGKIGGALPVVFADKDGQDFIGWSTTADGKNLITTVPDTETTLYAVFEETEIIGEYGYLYYHNGFTKAVTTKTSIPNDAETHTTVPTNYDETGVGIFSLRERFASFAIANDPAGSGNPVLMVTSKSNNERPTVKFTTPLTEAGTYTFTAKLYLPAASASNTSLMLFADPEPTGNHSDDLWSYVGWKRLTVPTDEWVTITRSYRIPEDISAIGQFGLLDSKNDTAVTYYLDDVNVWFQADTPRTSKEVSLRTDASAGIRFRANVAQNDSMTEFGFIAAREDKLKETISANETATGEGTYPLFYDNYLRFGTAAVSERANNNFSGTTNEGVSFVGARNYKSDDETVNKYALNDDGSYSFSATVVGLNAPYTTSEGKTYTTRYDVSIVSRAYAVIDGQHFYGSTSAASMMDLAEAITENDSANDSDKAFAQNVLNNSKKEQE